FVVFPRHYLIARQSLSKPVRSVPQQDLRMHRYHTNDLPPEENKGVAAARNTGLQNATGELIYFVDADDFIDERAIELLVKKQQENDADIVGCSWYLSFNQNKRRMNQPPFNNSLEAIQQMLHGKMRWNLWLFMVKRSLYEDYNIRFIPGVNMGEDLMVIMKLFVHANKVAFVNDALYHYG
ncbi:glycosyltransferase family 2 protein, partial [Elizabethkingia miricola]|nr:glycosyltransferase family 2 protein [Elizabethkingia miricola]